MDSILSVSISISAKHFNQNSILFARLAGLFNFTTTTDGDNLKVKCRDLFRMDTGKLCEAETVAVRSGKVATSHAVTHVRNVHQYALPF
jgi:hypothetical protein